MNTDKTLAKFYKTFEHSELTDEWRDELANYVVRGYPPGSFHTAMLENNLLEAACRTHPMNQWKNIVAFMKWLMFFAPGVCWGSKDKVKAWLTLSADERRKICEDAGILASAWELLQEP